MQVQGFHHLCKDEFCLFMYEPMYRLVKFSLVVISGSFLESEAMICLPAVPCLLPLLVLDVPFRGLRGSSGFQVITI